MDTGPTQRAGEQSPLGPPAASPSSSSSPSDSATTSSTSPAYSPVFESIADLLRQSSFAAAFDDTYAFGGSGDAISSAMHFGEGYGVTGTGFVLDRPHAPPHSFGVTALPSTTQIRSIAVEGDTVGGNSDSGIYFQQNNSNSNSSAINNKSTVPGTGMSVEQSIKTAPTEAAALPPSISGPSPSAVAATMTTANRADVKDTSVAADAIEQAPPIISEKAGGVSATASVVSHHTNGNSNGGTPGALALKHASGESVYSSSSSPAARVAVGERAVTTAEGDAVRAEGTSTTPSATVAPSAASSSSSAVPSHAYHHFHQSPPASVASIMCGTSNTSALGVAAAAAWLQLNAGTQPQTFPAGSLSSGGGSNALQGAARVSPTVEPVGGATNSTAESRGGVTRSATNPALSPSPLLQTTTPYPTQPPSANPAPQPPLHMHLDPISHQLLPRALWELAQQQQQQHTQLSAAPFLVPGAHSMNTGRPYNAPRSTPPQMALPGNTASGPREKGSGEFSGSTLFRPGGGTMLDTATLVLNGIAAAMAAAGASPNRMARDSAMAPSAIGAGLAFQRDGDGLSAQSPLDAEYTEVFDPEFKHIYSVPNARLVHLPPARLNITRLVVCRNYRAYDAVSCSMGENCKFVHVDCDLATVESHPIHVNYIWRHESLCTYARLPAGETVEVLLTDNNVIDVPTERLLLTRGATAREEADGPLTSCQLYEESGMCNHGERCLYVHRVHVDPTVQGDFKRATKRNKEAPHATLSSPAMVAAARAGMTNPNAAAMTFDAGNSASAGAHMLAGHHHHHHHNHHSGGSSSNTTSTAYSSSPTSSGIPLTPSGAGGTASPFSGAPSQPLPPPPASGTVPGHVNMPTGMVNVPGFGMLNADITSLLMAGKSILSGTAGAAAAGNSTGAANTTTSSSSGSGAMMMMPASGTGPGLPASGVGPPPPPPPPSYQAATAAATGASPITSALPAALQGSVPVYSTTAAAADRPNAMASATGGGGGGGGGAVALPASKASSVPAESALASENARLQQQIHALLEQQLLSLQQQQQHQSMAAAIAANQHKRTASGIGSGAYLPPPPPPPPPPSSSTQGLSFTVGATLQAIQALSDPSSLGVLLFLPRGSSEAMVLGAVPQVTGVSGTAAGPGLPSLLSPGLVSGGSNSNSSGGGDGGSTSNANAANACTVPTAVLNATPSQQQQQQQTSPPLSSTQHANSGGGMTNTAGTGSGSGPFPTNVSGGGGRGSQRPSLPQQQQQQRDAMMVNSPSAHANTMVSNPTAATPAYGSPSAQRLMVGGGNDSSSPIAMAHNGNGSGNTTNPYMTVAMNGAMRQQQQQQLPLAAMAARADFPSAQQPGPFGGAPVMAVPSPKPSSTYMMPHRSARQ